MIMMINPDIFLGNTKENFNTMRSSKIIKMVLLIISILCFLAVVILLLSNIIKPA